MYMNLKVSRCVVGQYLHSLKYVDLFGWSIFADNWLTSNVRLKI